MSKHSAVIHLENETKKYKKISEKINYILNLKGKEYTDWPNWCFIPMAGWYLMICNERCISVIEDDDIRDLSKIAALGAWRYSQGIYRFDDNIFSALIESGISGKIPCDVLYRLPEWCVYIETNGMDVEGDEISGFWSHLEFDVNSGKPELRFLFDFKSGLIPFYLTLGDFTIEDSVKNAFEKAWTKYGYDAGNEKKLQLVVDMSKYINKYLSLLLYLCSEEPEIDNLKEPLSHPCRPQPKKIKKGFRLFPADKPRFWEVGKETGEKLRRAGYSIDSGRSVKAHLRRAHWHGFWTGPRKGERKFTYKWIPPIIVGN